MNYVRTTIKLPEELHQKLMMDAIKKRMTFSEVVVRKLQASDVYALDDDREQHLKKTLAVFDKLAESGEPITDAVAAVREDREHGHD